MKGNHQQLRIVGISFTINWKYQENIQSNRCVSLILFNVKTNYLFWPVDKNISIFKFNHTIHLIYTCRSATWYLVKQGVFAVHLMISSPCKKQKLYRLITDKLWFIFVFIFWYTKSIWYSFDFFLIYFRFSEQNNCVFFLRFSYMLYKSRLH